MVKGIRVRAASIRIGRTGSPLRSSVQFEAAEDTAPVSPRGPDSVPSSRLGQFGIRIHRPCGGRVHGLRRGKPPVRAESVPGACNGLEDPEI
jgi:hypothetical protein